jgi:5-methyltetrahydrofolate--homocysteine methyltransferase
MSPAERVQSLRDLFAQRIVVLDGAMGTMIQKHRLDEAAYRGARYANWHRDLKGCNDLLVLTRPQLIGDIHREFIDAGADIVSTNTFNATSIALADYGLESLVCELNRDAAVSRVRRRRARPDQPHGVDFTRRQRSGLPRRELR